MQTAHVEFFGDGKFFSRLEAHDAVRKIEQCDMAAEESDTEAGGGAGVNTFGTEEIGIFVDGNFDCANSGDGILHSFASNACDEGSMHWGIAARRKGLATIGFVERGRARVCGVEEQIELNSVYESREGEVAAVGDGEWDGPGGVGFGGELGADGHL